MTIMKRSISLYQLRSLCDNKRELDPLFSKPEQYVNQTVRYAYQIRMFNYNDCFRAVGLKCCPGEQSGVFVSLE